MKKLLGIVVLCLLVTFNVKAADYIFIGGYIECKIVTKKDPTTFQNLVFVKKKNIKGWDKRKEKIIWSKSKKKTISHWKKNKFKVFYFNATFETGRKIKILVNTEFKNQAKIQALKYAHMVGQLPNFLRKRIKNVIIHKGDFPWTAGTNITVYTGYGNTKGACGEEVLIHEAAHVSLDWNRGGSVKKSKWKKAAKADNKFITQYAKNFPNREDVADTITWWIAVRCKADNILYKSRYEKVIEGIPNRLKYFDEQNYDTYPLVCK